MPLFLASLANAVSKKAVAGGLRLRSLCRRGQHSLFCNIGVARCASGESLQLLNGTAIAGAW